MKTNKFFTLILSMVICVNFISCGDDEGNGNGVNSGNVIKRLTAIDIKSLDSNWQSLLEIEYSGDKVSKTTYIDYGSGLDYVVVSEYIYTADGVTEIVNYHTGNEEYSVATNYTLNEKGYIEKGEVDDGGTWTFSYYGDYMTSSILLHNGNKDVDNTYNFNEDGLMISNDYNKNIEYTNILNLGGLYLGYEEDFYGRDLGYLQYTNLLGKAPKYLPERHDGPRMFQYELDEDGYVEKVKVEDFTERLPYRIEITCSYERIK